MPFEDFQTCISKTDKCLHFYPSWEGTIVSMQPVVGQGATKYIYPLKQAPVFSYLRLPPPSKTVNQISNAVQLINHLLATLHWCQGCL